MPACGALSGCKQNEIKVLQLWTLNNSWTGFDQRCHTAVCVIAGLTRGEAKTSIFPLRCYISSITLFWKVCLTIDFLHLPKAWWTAARLDSLIPHTRHLTDINNQQFASSLFVTPFIRPNSLYLRLPKLHEAPSSQPLLGDSLFGEWQRAMSSCLYLNALTAHPFFFTSRHWAEMPSCRFVTKQLWEHKHMWHAY